MVVGTSKFLVVVTLALSMITAPIARADEDAVSEAEVDLTAVKGPQYFDASFEGATNYVRHLRVTDAERYERVLPAFERLAHREDQAIGGAAFFAFTGTLLAVSSVTFLRLKKRDSTGLVHQQANTALAGMGLGFFAMAFLFYELASPSKADLLDFVNAHNRVEPTRPLHYETGVLRSGDGITFEF